MSESEKIKAPGPAATMGERIRFVRRLRRMSPFGPQHAVRPTATCVVQACGWEGGRRKPGADSLAALCRALDVSADYLLGLAPEPTPLPKAPPRPGAPKP